MMSYTYACPHCGGSNSLDDSDLRPVGTKVLGAERQCSYCQGWARIRVAGPDRELTVEKG
jgi:hypothetical protein